MARARSKKKHGGLFEHSASVHTSPKDQDPIARDGYVDPRYADVKKREGGPGSGRRPEQGYKRPGGMRSVDNPKNVRRAEKKAAKVAHDRAVKNWKESRTKESRSDDDGELHNMMGDFLNEQSKQKPRKAGWNGGVYTPPILKRESTSGLVIKEF